MPLRTSAPEYGDEPRNRIIEELLSRTNLPTPRYGDIEASRLPVGDPSMLMTAEQFGRSPGARGLYDASGGTTAQVLPHAGSDVPPTAGRTGGTMSPMSAAQVRPPATPAGGPEGPPGGREPAPVIPPFLPPNPLVRSVIQRLLERDRTGASDGRDIRSAGDVRLGIGRPPE